MSKTALYWIVGGLAVLAIFLGLAVATGLGWIPLKYIP